MNKAFRDLNKIYKVAFPRRNYLFFEKDGEVYILAKSVVNMASLLKDLRTYHIGLKILDYKGRPTYSYAQLVGADAADNFIIIDHEYFIEALKKGYIDKKSNRIIEDKGDYKIKILKIKLYNLFYAVGFVRDAGDKYLFEIPRHYEELIKV